MLKATNGPPLLDGRCPTLPRDGTSNPQRGAARREEQRSSGTYSPTRAAHATTDLVRLADRYALAFLPATLALAPAAWAASGELVCAVAVFVVATLPAPDESSQRP